jgi:hypothetical protein
MKTSLGAMRVFETLFPAAVVWIGAPGGYRVESGAAFREFRDWIPTG